MVQGRPAVEGRGEPDPKRPNNNAGCGSVLQRRTSYYQEKLFKNGKTIARRDTVGDMTSGGTYDYTKSSTTQPNYWTSSTGYFAFRPPRNGPGAPSGSKFQRSPSPEDAPPAPPLPHGSNSVLALKRFTDADLELNKQRYYGEFIMRRDQVGDGNGPGLPPGVANPTSSSTISEDNSSQQCLINKPIMPVNGPPLNQKTFRNSQQPSENVTTIKIDESIDGNENKSKKMMTNSLYSNQKPSSNNNNQPPNEDSDPNSSNSTDAKLFQSFLTARKFAYPNMTLLRRINERYKKTEHFFMALKIFSLIHLIVGISMLALDWAQAILLWEDVSMTVQRKIYVVLRCLYPVYILIIAATSTAVALHKRALNKTLKLFCIMLLAVLCLVPSDFVLVQSMAEAIQFSVSKRQATAQGGKETTTPQQGHLMLNDDPATSKSRHPGAVMPRLVLSTLKSSTVLYPTSSLTKNFLANEDITASTTTTLLQQPDFGAALNELINNPSLYKNVFENYIAPYVKQLEAVNTVHHLRIAYCLFGGAHIILTLLTLFTTIRLEAAP